MPLAPLALIAFLQAQDPLWVDFITMIFCYGAVVAMLRLFGKEGLYAYIPVALIGANLQVLKVVYYPSLDGMLGGVGVFNAPVALGTVLFTSTYLCADLLAEHYGRSAAMKGVFIGFIALCLWTVITILTLGYQPLTAAQAGESHSWALPIHAQMSALLTPAPALLIAGMISYLISETYDVWLFVWIRKITGDKALWLRNNVSTLLAGLIDNTVFSVLAWVVFAENPVGLNDLIFTYILGTYLFRVAISLFDTPFMYAARFLMRRNKAQETIVSAQAQGPASPSLSKPV
jgi:queuosine precursor transporter